MSWSLFSALTRPPTHPGNNLSELIKALLSWLYLSFYWSEDDQNFREDLSKILDHIQIKIRMTNPSQEHPASSKATNQYLKDMGVMCTLKIKIESQNWEYWWTKDKWTYLNQYQDANTQAGTSSILQSSKSKTCYPILEHGRILSFSEQN